MNSSQEFHVEFEGEDFDFFDPIEFGRKVEKESAFSFTGGTAATKLFETRNQESLLNFNQKKIAFPFNFEFGRNESFDEFHIVPNDIDGKNNVTQPSSEQKKNTLIGGYRSSQTPSCSKNVASTDVETPKSFVHSQSLLELLKGPIISSFNISSDANFDCQNLTQTTLNSQNERNKFISQTSNKFNKKYKSENIGGSRVCQTPNISTDIIDLTIPLKTTEPPRSSDIQTNNAISRSNLTPQEPMTDSKEWIPEVLIANDETPIESISRIPLKFRSVFENYAYFNTVQSLAFNVVFTTDRPVVVSAPTSSGKTVIFELAIVRLLALTGENLQKHKVLFIAPTKAVVNEKFRDWDSKFSKFGVKCIEVTGDSDIEDYKVLEKASILLTTPEKWDSLTRKAQELSQVVKSLSLVLIDEVHCLNDNGRGATMEVVISRMKTINQNRGNSKMRFIAVSATIPNAEDISLWLGTRESQSVVCILPSDMRPVKLHNIVLGYSCSDSQNNFQFEKKLSYKVPDVIEKYSSGKPTLIFVPTRSSAITTAQQIVKSSIAQSFIRDVQQRRDLIALSNNLQERNLRELVTRGIGFHHAGLSYGDRTAVMEAFSTGRLVVLCCTTTLALGVNVPAHLVIIKSTFVYMNGVCNDLPESQVLQMIGRAGRPQFDTSAVAVIMTKDKLKAKYEKMLNGTQIIESFLHKHLAEHINAEIVLKTITDVSVACEWIHSTFLYIRVMKNKAYYGIDVSWDEKAIEKKLQEWCIKELNGLKKYNLIKMDDDCAAIVSTEIGQIMARYCVSVESIKKFMQLKGNETIKELVELISSSEEVTQEMRLRTPERTQLNSFNETTKNDPGKELIRFKLKGKIKSPEMKANCLIQVMLGNMRIDDYSLYQDSKRVLKSGQRVTKCLLEYLMIIKSGFSLLVNGALLAKCFRAGIWEDSPYVTRQLNIQSKEMSINVSRDIAAGGLTSFEAIESAIPPIIEMFAKKQTPFGRILQNVVRNVPRYEIEMEQLSNDNTSDDYDYFISLQIKVVVTNITNISNNFDDKHSCLLLVGNYDNEVLSKQRIYDRLLMRNNGEFQTEVNCRPSQVANKTLVRLISETYVGIDVSRDFFPKFDEKRVSKYFANRVHKIKLPKSNSSIPKELKFYESWKHLCNVKTCQTQKHNHGSGVNITLKINNKEPISTVESVKRKRCEIGPMDRYIDYRKPQALDDEEEMMSDPEFDALLANYEFPVDNAKQHDKQKYEELDVKAEEPEYNNPCQPKGEKEESSKLKNDENNIFNDFADQSVYNIEKTREKESTTKSWFSEYTLNTKNTAPKRRNQSSSSDWQEYENFYRKKTKSTNYELWSSVKKICKNENSGSQRERTKTSFTFDGV